MLAIELTRFGDPREVITVTDVDEPPAPAPGQVLIQVEYAPIDHHDFLLSRGTYPTLPPLPSVMGHEGSGTIAAVGDGVAHVKVGDAVVVPYGTYAWAQRVLAPADDVAPLLEGIDLKTAALLRINPSTAGLLLALRDDLPADSWVVQNAANSGVGRSVIAFARDRGLHTVNLVRRPELIGELQSLGADIVVVDDAHAPETVNALLDTHPHGGKPALLALDGVSGTAANRLARLLSAGGLIVSYARMGGQAFSPDAELLDARLLSTTGFYMYSVDNAGKLPGIAARAQELVAAKRIVMPIAAVFPAAQWTAALERYEHGGKVLLDFNPDRPTQTL